MRLKTLLGKAGVVVMLALAAEGVQAQSQAVLTPRADHRLDAEYRLGPEDVVEVWVWKETELSTTAMVRPDGKISLPLIGELEAKGKTAIELQAEMRKLLQTYLANPVVTVIVKEVNYPKISVLGQVRKPDMYKIRQKITVLDAIALAGGFTDYAKRDQVIVFRNSSSPPKTVRLNLKRFDAENGHFYLQPFDTVYVE